MWIHRSQRNIISNLECEGLLEGLFRGIDILPPVAHHVRRRLPRTTTTSSRRLSHNLDIHVGSHLLDARRGVGAHVVLAERLEFLHGVLALVELEGDLPAVVDPYRER